jgi:hypothetical protein
MIKLYEEYINPSYDSLNEEEQAQLDRIIEEISTYKKEELNESILSSIIGGTLGYIIGPSLGKRIANALGIEKGPLYDLFTSKLVNISIGQAISKGITGGYKNKSEE